MRKLREKRATVEIAATVPAPLLVILFVAVPKGIHLHQVNVAQALLVHQLLKPHHGRRIAVLHHAEDRTRHFERFEYNPFGIGLAQRNGFFEHHMLAGLERLHRVGGMVTVEVADVDHVNIIAAQHLVIIGIIGGSAQIVGELLLGQHIAHRHQFGLLVAADHLGVTPADMSISYYGKFDFVHEMRVT